MHRRTGLRPTAFFLVVVAFVASQISLSFAATAAPSSNNLIVGLDVTNIQTVDAEVAVDEGFFSHEHLNVTFVNLPADQAMAALESGAIEIGEADPASLLRAYDLGEDFKMLAGGAKADLDIVALDSIRCSSWHAAFPGPLACLVGHTIGTPTLGGDSQALGEYLIGQAVGCSGGGAKCVTWVDDSDALQGAMAMKSDAIQAQLSLGSQLPIYSAEHVKVFTVANASLSTSATGNAGKLVPLNVTAIPIATAAELAARPKVYEGFCQAIANANAWLALPRNLKKSGAITENWLGDGTSLTTATAEVKAQNSANLLHISPAQWRGSERSFPGIAPQPYSSVDWSMCDRVKPRLS